MGKPKFFFLLWLLMLPVAVWAQNPGRAAFKQGEDLRKNGDYNGALQAYEQAIRLEDNNYIYHARKGMVLVSLKRFDEAKGAFLEAARVNPAWTSAYVQLAKLALRGEAKDYNGAIGYLNKAYDLEQDVSRKVQYKLLAIKLLLKQNRPSDAMAELQRLKSVANNDLRVFNAEGEILMELKKYAEAKGAFNNALSRAAELPPAQKVKYYVGLAIATYNSGQQKEADQMAETNIKPYSDRYYKYYRYKTKVGGSSRYLALAQGYLRAKAYDEAIENIQKAVEAGDKPNLSYKMLGMAHYQQGKTQQAVQYFEQAAQAESDDVAKAKLYQLMVKLHFNNRDYSAAVRTADLFLAKAPTNRGILLSKAQALYQLGNYTASISAAEAASAQDSQDPGRQATYQFLIGLAAKKAGNMAKAAEAFKKAEYGPFKYAAKQEASSLGAR